jgi:hypothetical protein
MTTLSTPARAPYTSRRWGDAGAYKFPDDGYFRTINFSGGKDCVLLLSCRPSEFPPLLVRGNSAGRPERLMPPTIVY